MSRKRKRKPNRAEREDRRETQAERDFQNVVIDTAATFTCSTNIAGDFAWQCGQGAVDLASDILFLRIAHEIWGSHANDSKELARAIAEFLTEHERHQAALRTLEARFTQLEEGDAHEHLEPIETYRDLVRDRLNSDLASRSASSNEEADRLSGSNEF